MSYGTYGMGQNVGITILINSKLKIVQVFMKSN